MADNRRPARGHHAGARARPGGREAPDSGREVRLSRSRWAREEIVPVPRARRSLRWGSFAAIWFAMTAQMGVFALGASLAEAMPTGQAILAVAIANVAMIAFLLLIGDIGLEHGVNFAGYLRAPFGMLGSYLPLALRGLSGIAWFGIQTWLGATAIDIVTSEHLGISATWAWYIALGALQIALVAAGVDTIKRVVNVAAPALGVLSLWLLFELFRDGSVREFLDHPVRSPEPFVVGIVANLSYWTTVAVNLPDFTRQVQAPPAAGFISRNRHSLAGQAIGVPLGMLLFTLVGMAGLVFAGEENPVLAIGATVGGVLLLAALGVVVLAQVSTNITANLFASAYAANAIGAPRVSYALGALITGAMGLAFTFPWLLLEEFLTYLPALGAVLAPIAGIMIADYYVLRRRRLDVPALFERDGRYRYWRGANPAALIGWAAGAAAGLALLDYSFLVALPIGLVAYLALMRLWVLRRLGGGEDDTRSADLLATTRDRDWPVRMDDEG